MSKVVKNNSGKAKEGGAFSKRAGRGGTKRETTNSDLVGKRRFQWIWESTGGGCSGGNIGADAFVGSNYLKDKGWKRYPLAYEVAGIVLGGS